MKHFDSETAFGGSVAVSAEEGKNGSLYESSGLKRVLDLTASLCLLLVSAPLIGFLYLAVRLDGGPGFYSQERVGRGGKIFRCYKLRSMCVNADERLKEYCESNPAAKAEWDLTQKLKNDPRITGVGKFIRKYSLDELPQIWNVLTGDMSLIGPRPFMPDQTELYSGDVLSYYALRPGITGLWQVGDRNDSSFAARVHYDNRYARDMSLKQDVTILFKTVQVVLRGTGH